MSYNVLTGANNCPACVMLQELGEGSQLALDKRMAAAAERILQAEPDVIGFQENMGSAKLPAAYLKPLLTDYSWVLPSSPVTLAYNSARLHLEDKGSVVLEENLPKCQDEDPTYPRYIVWAQFTERVSGRTLWVFNTHQHPGIARACAKYRSQGIDNIISLIESKNPFGDPMLLTGDFNAYHNETRAVFQDHLRKLKSIGVVDSYQLAESDDSDVKDASSSNRMSSCSETKCLRYVRREAVHVDYVFVPDWAGVSSWMVMSGPGLSWGKLDGKSALYWKGIMASDHSPVIAKVSFN
jgi:endonuclease/exonuclease/phosphatase family metal-dependent hydrolase